MYSNTIQIGFGYQLCDMQSHGYKDQFLQLHPSTYFFIVNKPDEGGKKANGEGTMFQEHLS